MSSSEEEEVPCTPPNTEKKTKIILKVTTPAEKKRENASFLRQEKTLHKKLESMRSKYNLDIYLVINRKDKYSVYTSRELLENGFSNQWPPTLSEIVSFHKQTWLKYINVKIDKILPSKNQNSC
jgi:hypothetical protein